MILLDIALDRLPFSGPASEILNRLLVGNVVSGKHLITCLSGLRWSPRRRYRRKFVELSALGLGLGFSLFPQGQLFLVPSLLLLAGIFLFPAGILLLLAGIPPVPGEYRPVPQRVGCTFLWLPSPAWLCSVLPTFWSSTPLRLSSGVYPKLTLCRRSKALVARWRPKGRQCSARTPGQYWLPG